MHQCTACPDLSQRQRLISSRTATHQVEAASDVSATLITVPARRRSSRRTARPARCRWRTRATRGSPRGGSRSRVGDQRGSTPPRAVRERRLIDLVAHDHREAERRAPRTDHARLPIAARRRAEVVERARRTSSMGTYGRVRVAPPRTTSGQRVDLVWEASPDPWRSLGGSRLGDARRARPAADARSRWHVVQLVVGVDAASGRAPRLMSPRQVAGREAVAQHVASARVAVATLPSSTAWRRAAGAPTGRGGRGPALGSADRRAGRRPRTRATARRRRCARAAANAGRLMTATLASGRGEMPRVGSLPRK